MREEIISLIVETAQELGAEEIGFSDDLNEETVLFGSQGVLDSMGLVTLIIAVEQAIEDKFETPASLSDEKAMSQARSPYRTVATLADYAVAQLQGD